MKIEFNYITFSNEYKKVNESIQKAALNKNSKSKEIDTLFFSQKKDNFKTLNESVNFVQIANGALNRLQKEVNQVKQYKELSNLITKDDNAFKSQIEKLSQNINDILQESFNGEKLFSKRELSGITLDTKLPKFSSQNIDEFEDNLIQAQKNTLNFMKKINQKVDVLGAQSIIENSFDKYEITSAHNIDQLKQSLYALIGNF